MFTDMVGSTASAQADEAAALALRDEQERLLRPLFLDHHGREVKSLGDGFLVEFDSALRAVECAIDVQERLAERNARPGALLLQLRIGVHLGDVEQRGSDIVGDAVNVASRINSVAEPGGVCVSGAVQEQVRNKIPRAMERLPATPLKGVEAPMELYRVVVPRAGQETRPARRDGAGIAVLPFANISPDPNDAYFADGLTEELISVLSQLGGIRVISRTSVMQYRATTKSATQIGSELGAASILEGSVRKAGDRLRITVQLIEASSDRHLWAKSYDRRLDDVFAVQTEIASQVAAGLKVELRWAGAGAVGARPPVHTDSYLAYMKGRTLLHGYDQPSIEGARREFTRALALDPSNAPAHAGLADALRIRGWWEESDPGGPWDVESRRLLERARELDPNLPEVHASLGLVHLDSWSWSAAEEELRRALALNPSYSMAHNWLGMLLEQEGRAEEALAEFTLAEGADPLWSANLGQLAILLTWLGRLDEARVRLERMAERADDDEIYHVARGTYDLARQDLRGYEEHVERAIALQRDPEAAKIGRGYLCALTGKRAEAERLLPRANSSPEKSRFAVLLAAAYAELDDLDECFAWLELGFRTRNLSLERFRLPPRMARVRQDARFTALLRRMELP